MRDYSHGADMPKLLDLFCGAGGAASGYARAGFEILGIDNTPQPHYPFEFIEADALDYARAQGHRFEVIHASPPCQQYSRLRSIHKRDHPDLIPAVREILRGSGALWIMENVPGAPLINPVMLCGLQFGLRIFRHRYFESNCCLFVPDHIPHGKQLVGTGGFVSVAGHGDSDRGRIPPDHRSVASWRLGMGIDYMIQDELAQAIPPKFTEYLGKQLIRAL